MLGLFETILNLSLIGSIVILLIAIVRRLLRRIPTKYIYSLWALALFRLLCPKTPSSVLSLFNFLPKKKISVVSSHGAIERSSATAASMTKALGRNIRQVTPPVSSAVTSSVKSSGNTTPGIWQVLVFIWVLGMAALAIAILYKTVTMYRSLRDTRKIGDNVYSGPCVTSPFILGLLKPRIFMPQGLSEKEFGYLLHHEQTHLRRKDMVFKTIWIAALIIHWFNPLVWIAYRLFESDMEMSCDEEVIKNIGSDLRADYCMSLVSYARKSNAPRYLVSSLGFGKENVKARIRNVMKYRKISQCLSILCVAVVATIFICGFLNPVETEQASQAEESVNETSDPDPVSEVSQTSDETGSETSDAGTDNSTSAMPSFEAAPEDAEAFASFLEELQYDDEPLWGTPEWIEQHPHTSSDEYPEVYMPDGALFDLALPMPGQKILFDCKLEHGAIFTPDSLGDFTRSYVVIGETNPSDLIFIATEELSESELASYIQSLRDFGFIDVMYGRHSYIGYTEDGCYVIIESLGDIEKYTTIRFSSSTEVGNDTMGVG